MDQTLAQFIQYKQIRDELDIEAPEELEPEEVDFSNYYSQLYDLWNECSDTFDYRTKPKRFQFVMIMASSDFDTYDESIYQWKHDGVYDYEHEEGMQCVCSQHIRIVHLFRNTANGNTVYIGNKCIEKFFDDITYRRSYGKERALKYTGDKRQCKACGSHRINPKSSSDVKRCGPCEDQNKDMILIDWKACSECDELVDEDDIDANGDCLECKRTKEGYRQCLDCQLHVIEPNAKHWMKRCLTCYKRWKR